MSRPPSAPSSSPPPDGRERAPAPGPDGMQWAEIIQQLGAEIAGPLSTALERIHGLINTGQIDRQSLRTLRESVNQAREAGMVGQQLARLASGRLHLSRERLHLTQLLRGVLTHRSRESQARGIQVRQLLKPVEIVGDGALIFSLLNALMDWSLASTQSSIDLRLELTPWPVRARLSCRFANRALDLIDGSRAAEEPSALNSLSWRLVEQTALTMGIQPVREDEAGITVLNLEFPQVVGDEPGFSDPRTDSDSPFADTAPPSGFQPHSGNSKPLAGSHLLIITAEAALQAEIRSAIGHMGLIVDVVSSAEAAVEFCSEGLPHGILYDSSRQGPALQRLRAEVLQELPNFSFVEVQDGAHAPQSSNETADGIARVARAHLAEALPALLGYELARGI
ncbi:hypothetical protein [Pelomonas sp. KK5]|uniref:hypothetical protein n=1 Tax=Pelomonas sp. KK5 TaxID=1855730 RepID=UPI00117E9440|nr:hypothetical protein [Pelomonas sp. KK5]